jgi:hypothetical protein
MSRRNVSKCNERWHAASLMASSTPATEETGPTGREIEYRQGTGWYFLKKKMLHSPQIEMKFASNF